MQFIADLFITIFLLSSIEMCAPEGLKDCDFEHLLCCLWNLIFLV